MLRSLERSLSVGRVSKILSPLPGQGPAGFTCASRHVSLLFKDCVFRINSRIGSKLDHLKPAGIGSKSLELGSTLLVCSYSLQ